MSLTFRSNDLYYGMIMKNMDENFNINFCNKKFNKVNFDDIIRIVKKIQHGDQWIIFIKQYIRGIS